MCFELRAVNPIDDSWQARETRIINRVGWRPDHAEANQERGRPGRQLLVWYVECLEEAVALRVRVQGVEGVISATVRERTTSPTPRGKK